MTVIDGVLDGEVGLTKCGFEVVDLHEAGCLYDKPSTSAVYRGRIIFNKTTSAYFFFTSDGRECYGLDMFDIVRLKGHADEVSKPVTSEADTTCREFTLVVEANDEQVSRIKSSFFSGKSTEAGRVKAIHRGNALAEQRAKVDELGG